MESKKSSLKHDKFLSLARRMRAGGVPVFIAEDDALGYQTSPEGLIISQFGGVTESRVFDISSTMTGFCAYLKIASNLPRPLDIAHLDLELPWEDPSFHLLEDPTDHDPEARAYRFPGQPGLEYHISEVLNTHIDRTTLATNKSVKGCLLAFGGPMPDTIKHGETVPVILVVWDQLRRKYSEPLSLYADRSQKLYRANPKKAHRDLFACRDQDLAPRS